MSIFAKFTNKKVKNLNDKIDYLQRVITDLREAKINAQIDLSRERSGLNAELELKRCEFEVREARVLRELQKVKDSRDEAISSGIRNAKKELFAEMETGKKALRVEYKETINKLESQVKSLTAEKENKTGLYNGALLVIKALEKQVADYSALTTKFFSNLPTVDVKIAKGDNNVTVNS